MENYFNYDNVWLFLNISHGWSAYLMDVLWLILKSKTISHSWIKFLNYNLKRKMHWYHNQIIFPSINWIKYPTCRDFSIYHNIIIICITCRVQMYRSSHTRWQTPPQANMEPKIPSKPQLYRKVLLWCWRGVQQIWIWFYQKYIWTDVSDKQHFFNIWLAYMCSG